MSRLPTHRGAQAVDRDRFARSPEHRYLSRVLRLLHLVALIALVLMPFTMSGATAEAHAMPAMSEGHCSDHRTPDSPARTDMAQCMLMCAALPAAEGMAIAPPAVPKAPRRLALASPIHGVILEIATPPPRLA